MRPEDDSVKAIESIDDNCEIRWPVKRSKSIIFNLSYCHAY